MHASTRAHTHTRRHALGTQCATVIPLSLCGGPLQTLSPTLQPLKVPFIYQTGPLFEHLQERGFGKTAAWSSEGWGRRTHQKWLAYHYTRTHEQPKKKELAKNLPSCNKLQQGATSCHGSHFPQTFQIHSGMPRGEQLRKLRIFVSCLSSGTFAR